MFDYSKTVRLDATEQAVKVWLQKVVTNLQFPYGRHQTTITSPSGRSSIELQTPRWDARYTIDHAQRLDKLRIRYAKAFAGKTDADPWTAMPGLFDAMEIEVSALAAERTRVDCQWNDLVDPLVQDLFAVMAMDYPESKVQIYGGEDSPPLAPNWTQEEWYQRLTLDERIRYDFLRPHKENWEQGHRTDDELARLAGKAAKTIRGWRRGLRERGAPDMDWKKATAG